MPHGGILEHYLNSHSFFHSLTESSLGLLSSKNDLAAAFQYLWLAQHVMKGWSISIESEELEKK